MLQQIASQLGAIGELLVALEQERFDVGALGMGTFAWLRWLHRRLWHDAPVEEGQESAVALDHRVGVEQVTHRGLVKGLRRWYHKHDRKLRGLVHGLFTVLTVPASRAFVKSAC
jgi:hypothetical protein